MKTTTTTAIVLSLVLATGGAMAALPKIEGETPGLAASSTGDNSGCLDFLALWAADDQHSPVGDDERIDDVTSGTGWQASSDEGTVYVDFYDEDGVWIIGGPDSGSVPGDAAYAYGCVTVGGEWPDAPVPGASFTYEDGL